MATEINRICKYCGQKLKYEIYKTKKRECICYCDNDKCSVKPCTDLASPSQVYEEILAITGDKQ